MTLRLIVPTLALCVVATGCSRNATITRHDGWQIDAEITRSTDGFIYARPHDAPEVEIARRDIADVDHPGNVMGVIGLSFMGAYTLNVGLGAYLLTEPDPYNREVGVIQIATGATGMLIGAGFAYWGWSLWDRSITAVGGSDTWPSVRLAPTLLSDDEAGAGLGAGLHFEF